MDIGTHISRHHGVLGTVVEIQITTPHEGVAQVITAEILAEITRLERIFSIFDPDSEIRRWQRGETEPGAELRAVIGLAERWRDRSGGAFNPAVGALMGLWDTAAARGVDPDPDSVAEAVASTALPRYRIVEDVVLSDGAPEVVNLNAIAKGWIVDRAMGVAAVDAGVAAIVINAGGDMLHRGQGPIPAGIENPHRPYDNEPPLTVIDLDNQAIATSGLSRRGWVIKGRWRGHVIDPRTGYPVDHVTSASVVALDAATADVVATILTVMTPDEGIAYAEQLADLEAFVVTRDRTTLQTGGWPVDRIS